MTTKNVLALESITQTILNQWCVDPKSIFYTGHSDGGTVAMALALLPEAKIRPRAIAPSAMGMDNASLAAYDCPPLTDVLVLHNSDDDHFPGFGKEAESRNYPLLHPRGVGSRPRKAQAKCGCV